MCSGFLVTDVFSLLLCVSLLGGSISVVVGLSPCTALLDYYWYAIVCTSSSDMAIKIWSSANNIHSFLTSTIGGGERSASNSGHSIPRGRTAVTEQETGWARDPVWTFTEIYCRSLESSHDSAIIQHIKHTMLHAHTWRFVSLFPAFNHQ